jgi:hypothetical protein
MALTRLFLRLFLVCTFVGSCSCYCQMVELSDIHIDNPGG